MKTRPFLIKDTDNPAIKEVYSLSTNPPTGKVEDVKWQYFLNKKNYLRIEEYNVELNVGRKWEDALFVTVNYNWGDTYVEQCDFLLNEAFDLNSIYVPEDLESLQELMDTKVLPIDGFSPKFRSIILNNNPNASNIRVIDGYNLRNDFLSNKDFN